MHSYSTLLSVTKSHLPAIKIPEFYHHNYYPRILIRKKGLAAAATNCCQIVTKCCEFFLTTWLAEICEADPRVISNKTEKYFSNLAARIGEIGISNTIVIISNQHGLDHGPPFLN
jgi:hypothetical protein